ncbi:MAG: histidine kinase [Clostridiales bacterium]|nr:histidine kinase [Clostridiales bacterium]
MKHKFSDLPLQLKIAFIYVLSSVLILVVNMSLLIGITTVSARLQRTYEDNLSLNEMTKALSDVQYSMTQYLNVKSSDSLEEYYISEQTYRNLINELNVEVTDSNADVMQRNIKYMSEEYLDLVSQTVEAKRGRNVEKYRQRYELATEMYNFINSYIDSLNTRQFEDNSKTYSEISRSLRSMQNVSLIVIIAVIVTNAFAIINYTGRLIRPLRVLSRSADEVAKGNFDVELPRVESKDEIGVVTKAFNKMVVSIRNYIDQIKENMELERQHKEKELMMETHLKDAQLKYLQAQINPHFLFNTLNAGAQLAMMEGADKTYEFVQNMSEFFRYNINKNDEIIKLRDEIELVNHYMFIINVRFAGEITFIKDIDESLLDADIPSMIIQPLVENAVNHGVRNVEYDKVITVSVKRVENNVRVSVKDNGVGMSEEIINEILSGNKKKRSDSMDSNGVGLDNVIERLKIFLDSDDVMSIVSEGKNKGSEFLFYLPIKETDYV